MSSLTTLVRLFAVAWLPTAIHWFTEAAEIRCVAVSNGTSTSETLSQQDWDDIRAEFEANQHAIEEIGGRHRAHNPGQGLFIEFDGRGMQAGPRDSTWTWGLQLESYGFDAAQIEVDEPRASCAEGGRLTYRWDDTVSEWYINDGRGLEHGFTIHKPPVQPEEASSSTLCVRMLVLGTLQPKLTEEELGVRFLRDHGLTQLKYTGLTVFDAKERSLPTRFVLEDERLTIEVDTQGCEYPLTVDPLAQTTYIKPARIWPSSLFGRSIDISGDLAIIGMPGDSSSAVGANSDPYTPGLSESSGAAYVYRKGPQGWAQEAYLKASNAYAGDRFGHSVAIDGDLVIVGAAHEQSSSTGIDSLKVLDPGSERGAAYLFRRDANGDWSEEAYIKSPNNDSGDQFGESVAVSGNRVVIGAIGESGFEGFPEVNGIPKSGAAYVVERQAGQWKHVAYLKAQNADPWDGFGDAVAVYGDTVVVGAPGEESAAGGINGGIWDNSLDFAGAAYVFVGNNESWTQQAYVKPATPSNLARFGTALTLYGDQLVVGSPGGGSGKAYVFRRSSGTWSPEASLVASNGEPNDLFGTSIDSFGDLLVVGSSAEGSESFGVNGDQDDNHGFFCGAAYVFRRKSGDWEQIAYLKGSNVGDSYYFGTASAISSDTVIIGAVGERSNSTGLNGSQDLTGVPLAGAAFLFEFDAPEPAGFPYCFGDGSGSACPCGLQGGAGSGCPTSATSGARLSSSGRALFHLDSFSLHLADLPANAIGLCLAGTLSLGNGNLVGDGLLCLQPYARSRTLRANAAGDLTMEQWNDLPHGHPMSGAYRGATTYYQFWFRDSQNTCSGSGFNFSNGLKALWQ